MNRCKICVIPDTRPDTEFVDGVCSACIAYESRKTIDWAERNKSLNELVARIKRETKKRGGEFDCVVPSSGGKDSTYQVLTLIDLGLTPLVVTATTCMLTDIGRKNIDNLKRYADTLESDNDPLVRKKLNRIGLRMVGDISWPEHVAIFTYPFRVASSLGIPFMFYGENPQNQYGGPLDSQQAKQMTRRWVSEFGGFLGLRPQDLIGVDDLTKENMDFYMPTSQVVKNVEEVEAHFLGHYIPWDSHNNTSVSEAAGFQYTLPSKANWWAHENQDNAQTGIHDYMMYLKYGYGRGAAQISVDIRNGRVTRPQAIEWIKEHDGWFPHEYMGVKLKDILAYINMEETEFSGLLKKFTNHDIHPNDIVPC